LAALKAGTAASAGARDLQPVRPTRWQDVKFKCVPLQEDEDCEVLDAEEIEEEVQPVSDPMGLSDLDLRATQELFASGRLAQTALTNKRATIAFLSSEGVGLTLGRGFDEDDEDEDEDYRVPSSASAATGATTSTSNATTLTSHREKR
jgi:hypothetical protein